MEKKLSFQHLTKFFPLIGILLFVYLIIDIGPTEIWQALLKIPPLYYALALPLFIPRAVLFAYKWKLICKYQNINASFWYLLKIYFVCMFYGTVTPGSVGWHMRIYYLHKKSGAPVEKCVANSLVDSTVSFIGVLSLGLIGAIVFFNQVTSWFIPIFLFFVVYVGMFVLLVRRERGKKIVDFLIKPILPQKWQERLDETLGIMYQDMPRLRQLLFPISIEFLLCFVHALQTYIILLAFTNTVPYLPFVLINSITFVIAALPISIGGIGVREGAFVSLLGAIWLVPQATCFAVSFISFLIVILVPAIAGLFYSFWMKDI